MHKSFVACRPSKRKLEFHTQKHQTHTAQSLAQLLSLLQRQVLYLMENLEACIEAVPAVRGMPSRVT